MSSSEDAVIDAHETPTCDAQAGLFGPMNVDASPTLGRIIPAIVQFQAALAEVPKTAVNQHLKNRYAPYDAVRESVQPTLAQFGLAWMPWPCLGDKDMTTVRNVLLHESGEWLACTFAIPLMASSNPAQAFVGAMTYASRVAAKPLGVRTGDDTDGEVSDPARPAPSRTPEQAGAKPVTKPAVPDDVKTARNAFYSAWCASGGSRTDKDGIEAHVQKANENPKLWCSKATPEQWQIATRALRGDAGMFADPDEPDPFANE